MSDTHPIEPPEDYNAGNPEAVQAAQAWREQERPTRRCATCCAPRPGGAGCGSCLCQSHVFASTFRADRTRPRSARGIRNAPCRRDARGARGIPDDGRGEQSPVMKRDSTGGMPARLPVPAPAAAPTQREWEAPADPARSGRSRPAGPEEFGNLLAEARADTEATTDPAPEADTPDAPVDYTFDLPERASRSTTRW